MPGLHVVYDRSGGLGRRRSSIVTALESLLHDERYRATILLEAQSYFIAQTGYREYPVQAFQLDDVSAFVEGRLYGLGPEALERKLRELVVVAFQANDAGERRVGEWLVDTDGDFVIILVHRRTGQLRIVNDVLGRLPLYCHVSRDGVIVSRELRFVARLVERLDFDRMALANFLLSGYVLGQRTWLESVDRLAPATLIHVDPSTREIRRRCLRELNFERKPQANRSIQENAAQLAELFLTSCETRHRLEVENVLSLSGGFDSRAIGAAFWRLGIPFRCATFLDHVGNATPDVPIARRLAQLFGVEWKLVELGPPTPGEVLRLLRMKNGLNPLGMSFLLPFLQEILEESDAEVSFLTGEMGTFTLPDPRPAVRFANLTELAQFLLGQYSKFSLTSVSALTGLDQADMLADFEQQLSSYPERDLEQRYVHFVTCERALTWHAEAEDRNRCYLWSVTPFSSIEFFDYATGCPDQQKSSYNLYREFLLRLMPSVTAIEHAGLGAPIASEQFRTASRVAALVGANPDWRQRLKITSGGARVYGEDSLAVHWLRRQLASGDALAPYISVSAARTMLAQPGNWTAEQLDHLLTVTSVIEDLATGKSVLEQE